MRDPATHAAFRFGLGPAPGEAGYIGQDPRGWLLEQLAQPPRTPAALRKLDSADKRTDELLRVRDQGTGAIEAFIKQKAAKDYLTDLGLYLSATISAEQPFLDRLAIFWANHFTVSVDRPAVFGLVVPFYVEAIRPNLLGRFSDLLIASTRHQAMLLYLDQAVSFGPNSKAGFVKGFGLNENLAREILELHTLGVEGGYTQTDVRQLALILTGWTLQRPQDPEPGAFQFVEAGHEPGDKELLGRQFREAGLAEGMAALEFLATRAATARFVATKLARHFIADEPPLSAIEHLAAVFSQTGGDLPALYRALIELDAAWQDPLGKLRTPQEIVIATLRALQATDRKALTGAIDSLKVLGQLPFYASSPAGYSDRAKDWAGPDQVLKRVDWAATAGDRIARMVAPLDFLATALGGFADSELLFQVDNAPSRAEAMALVLASPTFQRR